MAYSKTGIINLGLGRIGVNGIANVGEDSTQAIAANLVWSYILDEVLESRDWVFAKTRVALAMNTTTPVSGYDFAYTLPSDFLRLGRDKKNDPVLYPSGGFDSSYNYTWRDNNLNIAIPRYSYVIETLPDGKECLFINYDNSDYDLFIRYIRRISDVSKFSAKFVSAVAYRIGQELAYKLTESTTKEESMRNRYEKALRDADALNESGDSIKDETGNTTWEFAGR